MKLGRNLFRKDRGLWGKPIIEYDQSKMNELFSEMEHEENTILQDSRTGISLETELYLMLHS